MQALQFVSSKEKKVLYYSKFLSRIFDYFIDNCELINENFMHFDYVYYLNRFNIERIISLIEDEVDNSEEKDEYHVYRLGVLSGVLDYFLVTFDFNDDTLLVSCM